MPGETNSPNMNLILPGVGSTSGPQWATDLNLSLSIIDSHTHNSGSGVPITPSGLNINSDLTLTLNNLIAIRSLRLHQYSAPLALAADVACLYSSGVDLYYNDGSGNQVRITASGGVAGTPGSIGSLSSPASATYSAGSATFIWQSDTNTAANMDAGSLILRNISASSFGLTLTPPTLSSNYTITLPALPASTKIMSINSSGNIGAVYDVDNSTLEISSNVLQVKDNGITLGKMADASVGTDELVDASVTHAKMSSLGQQISSSSGNFTSSSTSPTDVTNLTATLTTYGRPAMLKIQPSGAADSTVQLSVVGTTNPRANILILRNGSTVASFRIGFTFGAGGNIEFPAQFSFVDPVVAGTYAYKVRVQIISVDGSIGITNCVLAAYEL